ncbi:type II toxin-antitoxin system death-on-curing family toxin [Pampinifervens florentissimum]|uniref:type II toxin-antitoxin system death-on-curing family toxin n=1 Tax=Pampinifervens florentissimum TaxID=1632019 RepID=UPI0013B49290|nr:type II toxin-antitoxin system death-on-curing family toxin [Hydrogenobacter sp. T-8]QID33623.1 type II toxin-antitoxin system death-on-curing family toxin [Hydrogenobacter sp. T-8]
MEFSPLFYKRVSNILERRKELLLKLSEKELILPTTEEVVEINRVIMQEHKGVFGVRDRNLVESAIASVINKKEYEGENDLFSLGFNLFSKLIQNHPFVDGNKRTAVVVFEYFMEINGQELLLSNDQLYTLAVSVAKGENLHPLRSFYSQQFKSSP